MEQFKIEIRSMSNSSLTTVIAHAPDSEQAEDYFRIQQKSNGIRPHMYEIIDVIPLGVSYATEIHIESNEMIEVY